MMIRLTIARALLCAMCFSVPAGALAQMETNTVYSELRGAAVFPDDDLFETGGGGEIALGYSHDSGLRGEAAFGFRHVGIEESGPLGTEIDGDVSVYTVLFNGYYDLDLTRLGLDSDWATRLRPYGGLGLGFGIVDVEADLEVGGIPLGEIDDTDTEFAWQFGLGAAYAFKPNWALLTTGWSFLEVDEEIHNVTVGLRYAF